MASVTINLNWTPESNNIGNILNNKDSDKYHAISIDTINSYIASANLGNAKITDVTFNATVYAECSQSNTPHFSMGFSSSTSSIGTYLLQDVQIYNNARSGSVSRSASLNAALSNNQLNKNYGSYITFRIYSTEWGKKSFRITNSSITITYTPQYTITATTSPAEGGSVSGSGTYSQGSTATLTATANTDYRFKQWQDGNTDNPRSVTVSGNATYTAEFEKTTFTISGTVSPANSGTVDGAKAYTYGDTATLTAIPNEGYDFVKWSDGVTDNPRTFTVTGAATFVAEFKLKTFVVSVRTEGGFWNLQPDGSYLVEQLGTVTGAGVYEYGQQATLTATPLVEGWLKFEFFYSESPEDYDAIYKDNPFIFTVTNNRNLCAKFAYIVQILPLGIEHDRGISIYGYAHLTYKRPIELPEPPVKEDTDQYHYEFDGWYSDSGNKLTADIIGYDTPIEITGYIARFTKTLKKYVVTTVATKGSITGVESGSSYEYGTTLALTAVPNKGHEFLYWMIIYPDGSHESFYDKSIEVAVTDNIEILAAFRKFRPRITSTQLLYSNKQISADNKVPVGEYFRIVVGVESYD